jgi:hypothetical protein
MADDGSWPMARAKTFAERYTPQDAPTHFLQQYTAEEGENPTERNR